MKTVSNEESVRITEASIFRGQQAKQLLDNPVLKEYFIREQGDRFDKIAKTKPKEIDEREQIYLELKELEKFYSHLQKTLQDGERARTFLETLKTRANQLIRR